MTTGDLIVKLQQYPADTLVIFEENIGYCDIHTLRPIFVARNYDDEAIEFGDYDVYVSPRYDKEKLPAILIE